MLINQIIKQKRLEKGLSIEELSEMASLSKSFLIDLENGDITKPSPELVKQLIKPLGLQEVDNINPMHYKAGGIETIDYIQSKMTAEAFEGYLQGNVIKYISRYRNKNGIEDLHKAEWYLTRLIKEMQK